METDVPAGSPRRRPGQLAPLLVLGMLAAVGAWTLWTLPAPIDAAPDSGFDNERALEHLEFIARHPRPLGSPHHRAVRDYLVREFAALGLAVEVQDTRVSHRRNLRGLPIQVINVVARLPGTHGAAGRAVMLAAHYDSTPLSGAASHGAGDDGAAVAALLETARVLSADPPANDVIFLITDGEERGLLGARAFVNEHPWFAHVGVVFNFEARGTSGPSLMFQTSVGNGWLISQYARAAPQPRTSSIGYEIYRLMPNDTDFTIFRDAGLQGLNFAFIGDYHHYHRAGDVIENLDVRSMRHHGVQALALARHFGRLDLDPLPASGDAVYFNLGTFGVVHYPQRWSLPLSAAAAVLCAIAVALAARRGRIRTRGVVGGMALLLLNIALAAALAWIVLRLVPIERLDRQANLAMAGFTLLALGCTYALLRLFRPWASLASLAAAGLLVAALLALGSAALVPAASYLLIWPALFGAVALLLAPGAGQSAGARIIPLILAVATAVPLAILVTPVIYLAFLGLRIRLAPAVVAAIVPAAWALLPHLLMVARPRAARPWRDQGDSLPQAG